VVVYIVVTLIQFASGKGIGSSNSGKACTAFSGACGAPGARKCCPGLKCQSASKGVRWRYTGGQRKICRKG